MCLYAETMHARALSTPGQAAYKGACTSQVSCIPGHAARDAVMHCLTIGFRVSIHLQPIQLASGCKAASMTGRPCSVQKGCRQQHPSSRRAMRRRRGGPDQGRLLCRPGNACQNIHLHAAGARTHGRPGTFISHFGEGTGRPVGCQVVVSAVDGLKGGMKICFRWCLTSHRAG